MTVAISAGQFDKRITIQRRVSGKDARGQESTSWENLATLPTVWARVEPLRGREFFAAGQMQSEVTVRFSIRFRTDVEPTMRVLWKSQPYEIISVIDTKAEGVQLELMCMSGVRDAR